jgi:hypothetical protein
MYRHRQRGEERRGEAPTFLDFQQRQTAHLPLPLATSSSISLTGTRLATFSFSSSILRFTRPARGSLDLPPAKMDTSSTKMVSSSGARYSHSSCLSLRKPANVRGSGRSFRYRGSWTCVASPSQREIGQPCEWTGPPTHRQQRARTLR